MMNFTTQQLLYLVEIERTRSISQAALNLFMGQPNLSRILKDTEEALGYAVFERTRRGVRPTAKGEQFLRHARTILREAEFMEQIGPNSTQSNRFRVCLPRSCHYMDLTQQFLCRFPSELALEGSIRECHPRQALELLENGSVELAIIRYAVGYQDYFSEQAQARQLGLSPLCDVEYQLILSEADPLTQNKTISRDSLSQYRELLHRDIFYPEKQTTNSLYTVDRLAQLQLLQRLSHTYLWAEPMPEPLLRSFGLAQRPCQQGGAVYRNALLYKPQCAMSEIEKEFQTWIQKNR